MDTRTNSEKIKQFIKIIDKSVTDFTSEMTFIVNAMHNKNKQDDDLTEIRDGYMTARRENPDCIIIHVGPYFWKYRETINSGDLNPLLDSDFKDEREEIQGTLPENSKFDKVSVIMGKIKRTWHLFTPLEQETLKKKFKLMVSHYATFVGACKKMKELNPTNG